MTDDYSFSLFVLLPGWHVEPPQRAPYVVLRASSAPDDEEVADQDQVPSLTLALLCACPGLVVGLSPSPSLDLSLSLSWMRLRSPSLFLEHPFPFWVNLIPFPFLVRMILFVRQPHLFLSLNTPLLRPYFFLLSLWSFHQSQI